MILAFGTRILVLGLSSIWRHRLRSILTILGIVFGVCSVIAMLAIGEGASYEAQEQIKRLGSQNIIVRSVKPPSSEQVNAERTFMIEYGLTYKDARRLHEGIPTVNVIVPSRSIRADVSHRRRRVDAAAIGTVPWFLESANRKVIEGRFITQAEMDDCKNVCVLGRSLVERLLPATDPLDEVVCVEGDYYSVIGVMEDFNASPNGNGGEAALMVLYIPLTAARMRFGEILTSGTSGSMSMEKVELHEIIVHVADTAKVRPTAVLVRDMLERVHKATDYEIVVPLELLRQAERTKQIFNIVLGSIAAISLLVGGIGIMNIMLATVTERTREIGIRRALGAKRRDVVVQFVAETVLLSGIGGLIGLGIGVLIPFLITHFAGMKTIVVGWSLPGAFGISLAIGMLFGIYPAYRASRMDPIEALRHE